MAEQLVTHSDEIAWTGRAADAMRERVRDRAAHLREAAHAHDTAADSLEKHLAECDRLTEAIAGVERARVVARRRRPHPDRPDPARAADHDGVRATPTHEDQALAAFVATAARSQGLARRRAAGALTW